MKNTLEDLRNHLFAALEGLSDEEKPLDLDRAKAIAQVAAQVIESAKVEVQFLEVTGEASGSSFFPLTEESRAERTHRALTAGANGSRQ